MLRVSACQYRVTTRPSVKSCQYDSTRQRSLKLVQHMTVFTGQADLSVRAHGMFPCESQMHIDPALSHGDFFAGDFQIINSGMFS